MKVLLSIKPEFAEKIFNGTKMYEFRRSIFKKNHIKTVVVYASSPMQKVVGEFEIEHIIYDELKNLWNQTHQFAGIEEDFFFEYFSDKKLGYAIKIKKTLKYQTPLSLKESFNILPPQSFTYL